MLNDLLPRKKYSKKDYPNLDPSCEGVPIPDIYGEVKNITPVCIDAENGIWKIADRRIYSIDRIALAGTEADEGQVVFQFTLPPTLGKNTSYYIVFEGDFAINGTDYVAFAGDMPGSYPYGAFYEIDGGGVWTQKTSDLTLKTFDLDEKLKANTVGGGEGGMTYGLFLRDSADRTKVAQKILTGDKAYALGKIHVWMSRVGDVEGHATCKIYEEDQTTLIATSEEVSVGPEVLTKGSDYTVDLVNATFQLGASGTGGGGMTPFVIQNQWYWVVLESDLVIDGTNYWKIESYEEGGGGRYKYYDSVSKAWSGELGGGIHTYNQIWGKAQLSDEKEDLLSGDWWWAKQNFNALKLGDSTSHAKFAFKFHGAWRAKHDGYVTRITIGLKQEGHITKANLRMTIYPDPISGSPIGRSSEPFVWEDGVNSAKGHKNFVFKQIAGTDPESPTGLESGVEILVDATGYVKDDNEDLWGVGTEGEPILDSCDVIKDVYVNSLKGEVAGLDLPALASLKDKYPEALSIYLDDEMGTGEFLEKVEAGAFCKVQPGLDEKLTVRFYDPGEAGAVNIYEEDMADFEYSRLWSGIYQTVKVKYFENPTTQEFLAQTSSSDIAEFYYRNKRELEIETYLRKEEDAARRARIYQQLLGTPLELVSFKNKGGFGIQQIPLDKAKLSRSRAPTATGTLDATLFRVLELNKYIASGDITITAVPDVQVSIFGDVELSDEVAVAEYVEVNIDGGNMPPIYLSETIVVSENVTVALPAMYQPSVSEAITVGEYVRLSVITP